MAFTLTMLAAGILLLYFGSGWLVKGASNTALAYAIRPAVVGLTVVSVATSAPELLVSLAAAAGGSSGVSVGNILGSNVFNISLVLGISAFIKPLPIDFRIIKRDIPYMTAASILFWILCADGRIGRLDGAILTLLLIIFLGYSIITARDRNNGEYGSAGPPPGGQTHNIFLMLAGILSLALGAGWVVDSAVEIARSLHMSEIFIGLSIVAIGTSLPELATSAMAAARMESDISVGNIVGSNLFNICLVMGAVGLISPISIEPGLNRFEFPAMIAITVLFYMQALKWGRLSRNSGIVLMLCFAAYMAVSYLLSA